MTGCGSDTMEETTREVLVNKVDQTLELYADIEKEMTANEMEISQEFKDMKSDLTKMATEVKGKLETAGEEDGQRAIGEIDKLIENLQGVKKQVDDSLANKE